MTDEQAREEDDGMRLLSMGPTPDGGFGINLTGGPLHAFTAYLIELMTGPDGEMWNCMETKVQAADLKGTFILTVQRADGKTPMDLRLEAETRATTAREQALREAAEVARDPGFIETLDANWDEGVNYAKRYIHNAILSLITEQSK